MHEPVSSGHLNDFYHAFGSHEVFVYENVRRNRPLEITGGKESKKNSEHDFLKAT